MPWLGVQMALEKELAAKNRLEKEIDRWKGTDGKELERLRNEMAALEQAKEDSMLDLRRLERRCAFFRFLQHPGIYPANLQASRMYPQMAAHPAYVYGCDVPMQAC